MGIVHSKTKISEERKKELQEKFKYAAKAFGKAGTRSDHPKVPKEQQLSIDLGNKKVFGIIDRILKWIENKFKYFFPRYNLFPEVGTKERKIPGTKTKVKYFTKKEQTQHTLCVGRENGKLRLYHLAGEPYDTTNAISKGQKGYVAYVITLDGKLITHEHINAKKNTKYSYRHSTLAGGEPILCSGLMQVINGKITYIDNNSGHYKPTSANLYNAVKRFEKLFSEDAKVHCLTNWSILRQDLPFLCRLPDTKKTVKQFLERMGKKGRDGLTKYKRHFVRVKEYNEQYRQKLHLVSYKPIPILDNDDPQEVKMALEHSIRRIIRAEPIHKIVHMPKIELAKEEIFEDGYVRKGGKVVGINITFSYKDDSNQFIKLLDDKKCSYIKCKHVVFISTGQAEKFIKNTLQMKIDSIELLGSAATRVLA